jgi:CheY-like chemotaxis protein
VTILIVEDSDTCAATLEVALDGVTTVRVQAAEAALALLATHAAAAIVTDLNLPQTSGYELIRQVRAMPRYRRIPLVVVSAETDPLAGERALAAGADAFFPKPFSPALLRTKLEELIDAAKSRSHSTDDAGPGESSGRVS